MTVLGTLGSPGRARIDPRGHLAPEDETWGLDWGIGGDDRWYRPAREPAVRQRAIESTPVVETSLHVPNGNLIQRAYGVSGPAGLVVVGAVHIAQALAPMAKLAGFEVTVIDPREAFVRSGQLVDIESIVAWPDEAMSQVAPDIRTAVVTLTHDPKLDDPALAAAIGERGGVAPSLAVRASLRQDRASWVVRHRSGVTGTLSIDRVSGAALGVEVSWSELEVEIHAQEAQAATLAAELDGALKILPFLTPSTIAKIDRATLLATRKSG